MLKKILKYDLKAVYKYWWIGAVVIVAVSIVSSFCLPPLTVEEPKTPAVIVGVIDIVFSILSVSAFYILIEILVFSHFYRNLFTDQGYLTFTLPLKRSEILNSKLITSIVTMLSTIIVITVAVSGVVFITLKKEIFTPELVKEVSDFFKEFTKVDYLSFVLLIIEIIITAFLSLVFSSLFMFTCITIGAIITRKNKLLASIGIYFAANSIFSTILSIMYMCGIPSAIQWLDNVNEKHFDTAFLLIGLLIIIALSVLCTIMYTIQLYLSDKKLNLV